MSSVGSAVVIQSRPRRAEDRPVVVLLDEIREPVHKRQPELTLGMDPARHARFVRVSGQGLVPPPAIQILCRNARQALPLSASSRESDRTAGTYELSAELAAAILAAENCHVSLAGALVAIPYEMTLAVWGEQTVAREEQQQAQAQREAQPRDANAPVARQRLAANAGAQSDGTTRNGMVANGNVVLAKVPFNGSDYFHRWSKNGQNEFTPQGEEDLKAWKSMLTVIVYDGARTGDDLAGVANRVLEAYRTRGRVVKTDSKPRTRDREAEHFAAVVLGDPEFLEAAFARFLLFEQTGMVVVFSKRIYGRRVGDDMSAWLVKNGPAIEEALMSWKGIPSLTVLRALPPAQ